MNERIFRGQMIRPRPADNSGDIYRPDNGINPQPIESMSGYSSPVQFYKIDLTSAHVDFAIRVPKCMYIQTFCDGVSDGISIKLVDQSREAMPIDKVKTIPSPGITRIYVTNDVRQGRSKLTIMFWQTEPAGLSDQAENITLAELAVRNGSINSFDRRGEVIFQDSFSSLSRYGFSGSVGYTATLSTTITDEVSDVALKLVTPAVNANFAGFTRIIPFAKLTSFGIEIHATIPSTTKGKYYISLELYDGTNLNSSIFLYDASVNKYQYRNSSGTYTDLASSKVLPIPGSSGAQFHKFKVVSNPSNGKYIRIIVNNDAYEIPTIAIRVSASVLPAALIGGFLVTNTDATSLTSYVSKCIMTQNEP